MKRTVRALLVVFTFLFLLSSASCANRGEVSETGSDTVSERSKTISKEKQKNDSELMKEFDANGDGKLKVLFIGNSYTYSYDIPAKFKSIAKTQGIDLGVYIRAEPGYKLSQHFEELPNYPDYITNADIVIMQDFGGFWADTDQYVPKLQALFNEKVKFYYYPYIAPSSFYGALKIENIIFLKLQ